MKNFFVTAAAGCLALLALSGCGRDLGEQAEITRELEESFALNSTESEMQSSPAYSEGSGGPAWQTAQSAASQGTDPSSPAPSHPARPQEASPAIRQAAQEVVQLVNAGQYSSAVTHLDRLISEPGLTPDQWIAARNAMAELQRRIVLDPLVSEAERKRARDSVKRQ